MKNITSPTPDEIYSWLCDAHRAGATHMLVVCDQWDYSDYPVDVGPGENVSDVIDKYDNPRKMLKVMEVFNLSLGIEEQLNERRAWHV